jgi:hypothetical protein
MRDIYERILQLPDDRKDEFLQAIGNDNLADMGRAKIENWSLIPFKGGTLIGDCIEHSQQPQMVKLDIQTSTVRFIDRREGGFAITRNTIYDLVGPEVSINGGN